ncbi:hypothetical protein [Clostridium ljungdahlii]|uniref:hypothetical protein n=1 Tax=Clostridium ljungdahlii TaxID=1538 RepID=UPI0038693750
MGLNASQKIIKNHLVKGKMIVGEEIAIKIDRTLTQDSTGTMAYLQFEALGINRVKTKKSVAYIDHNILQSGPENADDHLYIQTVAKNMAYIFQDLEMEYAIKLILKDLECLGIPFWVQTVIHLQAEV